MDLENSVYLWKNPGYAPACKFAENFWVALTKYIGIAVDVFIKRVFKGNTVTDRHSAPYRTSII